ncbi:hypothetical protein pb186bvf_011318 [Paramecium bursaria]
MNNQIIVQIRFLYYLLKHLINNNKILQAKQIFTVVNIEQLSVGSQYNKFSQTISLVFKFIYVFQWIWFQIFMQIYYCQQKQNQNGLVYLIKKIEQQYDDMFGINPYNFPKVSILFKITVNNPIFLYTPN